MGVVVFFKLAIRYDVLAIKFPMFDSERGQMPLTCFHSHSKLLQLSASLKYTKYVGLPENVLPGIYFNQRWRRE